MVLLLSWEIDDPDMISRELLGLRLIFEETFGYNGVDQIHHIEIPSMYPCTDISKHPFSVVKDALRDFEDVEDPETLQIVYCIGGASLDNYGHMIWRPLRLAFTGLARPCLHNLLTCIL
jgi:hypothetical protein